MGDGSLQSHSGANLNPKMVKDRSNVPKGGEAGGVALTGTLSLLLVLPLPSGVDGARCHQSSPLFPTG
jgi:hypothetical protein